MFRQQQEQVHALEKDNTRIHFYMNRVAPVNRPGMSRRYG